MAIQDFALHGIRHPLLSILHIYVLWCFMLCHGVLVPITCFGLPSASWSDLCPTARIHLLYQVSLLLCGNSWCSTSPPTRPVPCCVHKQHEYCPALQFTLSTTCIQLDVDFGCSQCPQLRHQPLSVSCAWSPQWDNEIANMLSPVQNDQLASLHPELSSWSFNPSKLHWGQLGHKLLAIL